jgi:hypothetical protein
LQNYNKAEGFFQSHSGIKLLAQTEGFKKSWLHKIKVGRHYAIARQEDTDPTNVGYKPKCEALRKSILMGRY